MTDTGSHQLFQDREWQYSYKTSSIRPDGSQVSILHDFYIPILKRSKAYDRVAGYFRSSSLAVASQGFSALAASKGKVRMIVGADLEQEDVAAILRGDEELAAQRLNHELDGHNVWPDDVRRGVELLSWMVAREILEVRVAFRVHGQTGMPVPFDSVEDGYVHEKWAVFTDGADSRIYISGSLNESRRALMHNAENITLHTDWWGAADRQRIDQAQNSFEQLWKDGNPFIKVLKLPEAVRQRLIQIGQDNVGPVEIDGSSEQVEEMPGPSAMELLKFALIKDGPRLPGGRFVGMETAPVKPWPHQEVVSNRLISTWPYSYLLCDEVGLGKTIEAGLAIRSLYLSGLVKRVLVAAPASLTLQWQREMAEKFFLPFARVKGGSGFSHECIFPEEQEVQSTQMYGPDLCIVSTGLMTRNERMNQLKRAESFDIVLVDEAHYARRKNPRDGERSYPRFGRLYETIKNTLSPSGKCLWLATATPMQLDWIEVFDLISLSRRIAHFQKDPSLTWAYYNALASLIHGDEPDSHEWELLRLSIISVRRYDPFLWSFLENSVIDGRIKATVRLWLEHGHTPRGLDRRNILKVIFAAAPLSRVMLRHTRPLLEIYREQGKLEANLARREILPVPSLVLSGPEKEVYDELERYCHELTRKISTNTSQKQWKTSLGFYLSFLRLRLASSTYAIKETIRRRMEKVRATLRSIDVEDAFEADIEEHDNVFGYSEDGDETVVESLLKNRTRDDLLWEERKLVKLLDLAGNIIDMPLKMRELLAVLEGRRRNIPGRIRQTVVFTRFYDTLTDIVNRLRIISPEMRVGEYSGQGGRYVHPESFKYIGTNREEIKHLFLRDEIDILICTDAAAEGLNLQTADLIINYDLPWNPMKVEQRIGRIDRIGQSHERIFVLNFCYADSAEQIVYDRLLKRLAQTVGVVGPQQLSMLPVTEEEFAQLASKELNEDTLFKRAVRRAREQQSRSANIEVPATDLYEIYLRMKSRQDKAELPVSLDDIWDFISTSQHLQNLGARSSEVHPLLHINSQHEGFSDSVLTIDRSLYEKGAPDIEEDIHFASYGDPVFDKVMSQFDNFELPQCILRLERQVPDTNADLVAYVVCCLNSQNNPETRLVTKYSEVKDLTLHEGASPDDIALQKAQQELHGIMRRHFDSTRSIGNIIEDNERSGTAHEVFNMLVADSQLPGLNFTMNDNFWQMINYMDGILSERESLIAPNISSDLLRTVQDNLLFNISVPRAGDKVSPALPAYVIKSALDQACRVADSLREKKSELTIGKVKTRIQTEIKHILRK